MPKTAEASALKEKTEKLCNDMEAVQMKLQTLNMVLRMYGEASDNCETGGICSLVAGSIEEARMNLLEISETIEMMGSDSKQPLTFQKQRG